MALVSTNQGMAVTWLEPCMMPVFQLAPAKAPEPPRPSISAWLKECRPFALLNVPTQVVPSWLTSGPTPLVTAAVILLSASLQETFVPCTTMLGCARSKAAASSLKYWSGCAPLGMYQNEIVTLGWPA